jgi:uncharacterized protein YcnI
MKAGRKLVTAVGAIGVAALVWAGVASAHATVSPAVAKTKALQQFTLSVPTEKEGLTTTNVELTVPSSFAIDSFEPPPAGWTQQTQSTGSGEDTVVQKVTWTGGHTPTEQDSVFRFNASVAKAGSVTFTVRQTYSDGSVVDWNGPESSDTPAPTFEALDSFGGGGTSTLEIVALVLAIAALVVAVIALVAGRGEGKRTLA